MQDVVDDCFDLMGNYTSGNCNRALRRGGRGSGDLASNTLSSYSGMARRKERFGFQLWDRKTCHASAHAFVLTARVIGGTLELRPHVVANYPKPPDILPPAMKNVLSEAVGKYESSRHWVCREAFMATSAAPTVFPHVLKSDMMKVGAQVCATSMRGLSQVNSVSQQRMFQAKRAQGGRKKSQLERIANFAKVQYTKKRAAWKADAAEGRAFIDGAMVANNPVMFAIAEATKLWPDRGIACIHSLGTGTKLHIVPSSGNVLGWVSTLIGPPNTEEQLWRQAVSTVRHIELTRHAMGSPHSTRPLASMVRLTPPGLGNKYPAVPSYKQIQKDGANMASDVEAYMLLPEVRLQMEKMAKDLGSQVSELPSCRYGRVAVTPTANQKVEGCGSSKLFRDSSVGP